MGNYDHSVQRNIDRKMSEFGMVPERPRELQLSASVKSDDTGVCDVSCIRSMEYLQRIVKSLLRQMRVHSHVFGPGEAITIDLQAELKYDDYVTLTKFMNSKQESDKYLYQIDKIISNFIHVVEHSSSRFEFLENIFHLPAFYSLKFWIILVTSMVIGTLIVMLFVKAFYTRAVHVQLLYAFLIIFILSCVWSFSSLYETKKAELHAHMVQSNGLPPKDCDYQNMGVMDSVWYFVRVNFFSYKDRCSEHYSTTMTDPFWKVNPLKAISSSVAFFMFEPMGYIGDRMGSFYVNFVGSAPIYMKPFMFGFAIFVTILVLYGPFRISTPLLTIEPAWRPQLPALDRRPSVHQHALIGGNERILRNEIMERPDGPVVKSVRNAATDMDGFHEYLTDEGVDEIEIIGPFSRFNLEENSCNITTNTRKDSLPSPSVKPKSLLIINRNSSDKNITPSEPKLTSLPSSFPKIKKTDEYTGDDGTDKTKSEDELTSFQETRCSPTSVKLESTDKVVECISLPSPTSNIKLIREELLRDALREEIKPSISPTDNEP